MPKRKAPEQKGVKRAKRTRRIQLPTETARVFGDDNETLGGTPHAHDSEPYVYPHLEPLRGHIRLLKLFPDGHFPPTNLSQCTAGSYLDGEAPLYGSLLSAKIGKRPDVEYIAVSHVWNDEAKDRPLCIDSKTLSITKTIACLLGRLRDAFDGEIVYVWIDTICINQEDLEERSHQVQQMDMVYRRAANVTIWLGEPPSSLSRYAIDLADVVHSFNKARDRVAEYPSVARRYGDVAPPSRVDFAASHEQAVDELLEHPWFGRMWVVQEAALARTLTVRLSWASCSWEELSTAAAAFNSHHTVEYESLDSQASNKSYGILGASVRHYSLLSFNEIRENVQTGRMNLRFVPLMLRCKPRRATDDRDKIYGLLGLLPYAAGTVGSVGNNQTRFVPDYNQPVRKVYMDSTVRCITQTGDLDILSTGITPFARPKYRLPSWAIDWSNRYVQPIVGDLFEPPSCTVAGMHKKADLQFHEREEALVLTGLFFDEVTSVAPSDMTGNGDLDLQLQVWREWRDMVQTSGNFNMEEQLVDNFWTALITDTANSIHKTNPIHSPSMHLLTTQTINRLNAAIDDYHEASTVTRKRLWYFAEYLLTRRKPFVTASGYVGLADPGVKAGDKVCILDGGRMFFLLREVGRISLKAEADGTPEQFVSHRLIDGRGYVQDLMYGEASQIVIAKQIQRKKICIV